MKPGEGDKRAVGVAGVREALLEAGMMPTHFTGQISFNVSQGALVDVERREKRKL